MTMQISSIFEPKTRSVFIKSTKIPATNKDAFEYHAREGALERLVPPWSILTVTSHEGNIRDGAISDEIGYSIIEDKIAYSPPFGKLGPILLNNTIKNNLNQLFHYRHRILSNDINLWKIAGRSKGQKILITGSHGLIGSSLIPLLTAAGEHKITRLARPLSNRSNTNSHSIVWDPSDDKVNVKELEGFDVVVHLAGENIFGRWTDSKKQRILESRIKSTRLLCDSLIKLANPPSTLICASATGFY